MAGKKDNKDKKDRKMPGSGAKRNEDQHGSDSLGTPVSKTKKSKKD